MRARSGKLPLLAPEVVQTSGMDCGPASLKCLLEGFGIRASYGRLREACQTDVDGTSVDTIEDVANLLGLRAEQVMLPLDHVLLPEARTLPALAVVRLASGLTHFVILWRRHRGVVQVMDPATGRRWSGVAQLEQELYLHKLPVSASDWREWAGSEAMLRPLQAQLAGLGVSARDAAQAVDRAVADPGWTSIAALDAATRLVGAIVRSDGLARGPEAARALQAFFDEGRASASATEPAIPAPYWFVRPLSADGDDVAAERLLLRGAVLVRALGRREPVAGARPPGLTPELAAALTERPGRPGAELLGLLRADGVLSPLGLLAGVLLAAAGVAAEALLLRGLLELGGELSLVPQRLGAMGAILAFMSLLLGLELANASGLVRLGRRLEARLRIAFLDKIPRLDDAYFQSRPTSDMAQRGHSIHLLRQLPRLGGQLVQSAFTLLLTAVGIVWLDPGAAPAAALAAGLALGLPLAAQGLLVEGDLRLRTHAGALGRFYLDAMLGLVAIRACGAERAMRREHDGLLAEWAAAGRGLERRALLLEGAQALVGVALAGWLFFDHVARVGETGGVLLLLYWALHLPVLGEEVGLLARQYPAQRNVTLRLLEPLGAPEPPADPADSDRPPPAPANGAQLRLADVSVRAGGHLILQDVDLEIAAGSHVAIVGPSGAGKSTLVGLLLGWYRPATGSLLADDRPLRGDALERLRRVTAWVDPQVRLWNRTFLQNLHYGEDGDAQGRTQEALRVAQLREVLERLPLGLQTPLGDGGALVSGGEGQRVRLGRALHRDRVRLALLDEPFRGLARDQRRGLLAEARRVWSGATLLCVTHEIDETLAFPRVLVVERGRVIEDGDPQQLAARPTSRYSALLDADRDVRGSLWSDTRWRRLRLADGRLEPARP